MGEVLTVKEVAAKLKCALSTVYEMVEEGRLRSFKLRPGSRKGIRVLADSLEELARTGGASPTPAVEVKGRPSCPTWRGGMILRFKD